MLSIFSKNISIGWLPTNSISSFIIIFGTPETLYFTDMSENVCASIISLLILSFNIASLCAVCTAPGQWGQAKVINTLILTGLLIFLILQL